MIITENDGLGLGVSKGEEHNAEPHTKLRVNEHGAILGLGCRRNDDIESIAETVPLMCVGWSTLPR